jgi:hypothetical protein
MMGRCENPSGHAALDASETFPGVAPLSKRWLCYVKPPRLPRKMASWNDKDTKAQRRVE